MNMQRHLREPRHHRKRRQGGLIVDAVIALALLATASIGLGKLASSSAALSRNADQRLAATLTGENVIQRLRPLAIDSLDSKKGDVADQASKATGFKIEIEAKPFQVDSRDAIHLLVTVHASKQVAVTVHDWRISGSASDAGSEDAERESQAGGDDE